MTCPNCTTENAPAAKFCVECGAPLRAACPTCGAAHAPGQRFCAECGVALPPAAAPAAPAGAATPATERRLVSVLFADLVGFTTLSETRDAEDVRELLSRYFESCRRLIDVHGGTVEKFIGDAVMAVWGAPTAQEDDAERAVRTALDLIAAVSALGDELGVPGLSARAGVLTGEAAVTVGATGQGMVAGDLVNTAARLQAVAEPRSVLVGEATRRASEAAIAYRPAGSFELKGKSEPVTAWRALRVTAGRGGAIRPEGLEAPFVGRDRELRLVKELFHGCAEQRKAHLVSVVGIGGIGKSRLAWEFEKYLDGLADEAWWHRGRCLAYGDGVAYWALAEMVRMRARISEEDGASTARAKLAAAVAEHVPDAGEREWLEPRLAHLIGAADGGPPDRSELFSAWRLFFERLCDEFPTVLVFEDLQWADMSLLDFVEHLLDWSRDQPLFVLTLTRPELADRRPGFAAAARNATTLSLEPLSTAAMRALLDGLVPELPDPLAEQILAHAEGVPLYAVETVRMLLDRGLLERAGDSSRPTAAIASLDVPETLHALIAARLDGLDETQRRIVQDASVLGKTFSQAGLEALTGMPAEALEQPLAALIRREVLALQSDPRSPERGQLSFVQDLLRRVAYETLSRRDRRSRHLAAAEFLERAWPSAEQEVVEVVEVVAAHYLDALELAPDAADADEIRTRARERLVLAGERAASLAATPEAERHYARAAALAADDARRALLLERAGDIAAFGGRIAPAVEHYERAIELHRRAGATHPAARVSAALGRALYYRSELHDAATRMEAAFAVLADDPPDADLAALAAELARVHYFLGDRERAAERIERALEIAEAEGVPGVLVEALNTKHLLLNDRGRLEEALALLQRAHAIAVEHRLGEPLLRALVNLSHQSSSRDDFAAAKPFDLEGLERSRARGVRAHEALFLMHMLANHWFLGEWDDLERVAAAVEQLPAVDATWYADLIGPLDLSLARGNVRLARELLDRNRAAGESEEPQNRASHAIAEVAVLVAEGRPEQALAVADRALALRPAMAAGHPFSKLMWQRVGEAALAVGDRDRMTELMGECERMRPVDRTPFLRGTHARFSARLAAERGDGDLVVADLQRARAEYERVGMPFYAAQAALELGEWLAAHGAADGATQPLADAAAVFEQLRAQPWLERAQAAAAVPAGG